MKRARSPTRGTATTLVPLSDNQQLPERVPLHPYGAFKGRGKDYLFDEKSLELVKAQLTERGHPYVVDWHHQTLDLEMGERDDAPAALWIKDVVVEDGYVWGVVESWTPKAAERVSSKEYRYLSAVFPHDAEGRVLSYHSFGLLNRPGTHHQRAILSDLSHEAIHQRLRGALRNFFGDDFGWVVEVYDNHFIFERQGGDLYDVQYRLEGEDAYLVSEPVEVKRSYERVQSSESEMGMNEVLKAVLAALGLPEAATKEQVLAKLSELQGASHNLTALAALTGQTESTAILGAVQAMKNNQGQLTALQAENAELKRAAQERRITELLDQGEADGKLSPADRQAILGDESYEYMRENPAALEGFLKLAAKKVDFGGKAATKPANPSAGTAALSDEEAEVAAQLGISKDDFKTARDSLGKGA